MTTTPELDHAALRSTIQGAVLSPGHPEYAAACLGFNLAIAHSPELIVDAASTEDVATAVRYASEAGLRVRVQATGHGIGAAQTEGMLIRTARMRTLTIDPGAGTATAGAGVIWRDVIEAAAPHGLAPLNGSSVTVGVVGYTLGGGMGPMARTFGFAADHVRRLRLVTADGTVVDVDAEHEPELFWALRGGKCEVGVVTEIEFGLMPVATFYGGAVFFPGSSAADVLHAYRTWAPALPESTTASIALLRLPDIEPIPEPLRGRLSVHLRYIHVGDEETGAALLAPMRAAAEPIADFAGVTPYAAVASVHQDPEDPIPAWDAGVLLGDLPAEAIDALLAVAGPDVDVPLILAEIRCLGGAAAREASVPNAVGGRDAAFSVAAIGPYPPPLRAAVEAAGNAVLGAVAPWTTGGTQINFQGAATDPEQVALAWPAATAARLREVKRTWDPEGRFRFGYSLG